MPLIEIGEPKEASVLAALRVARGNWWQQDALMLVSAAAVQHFFLGVSPPPPAAKASHVRFWAPGPGTARALVRVLAPMGFGEDSVDSPPADAAQFDSEHLWPVVASQVCAGMRLLVVRGTSLDTEGEQPGNVSGRGREWLLDQCRHLGAQVDICVAYERRPPNWNQAQRQQAEAGAGADCLWLFSSSEAVFYLQKACPGTDWSTAQALCTHERIGQAARSAGFGTVHLSRPALDDVLRSLESLQSRS